MTQAEWHTLQILVDKLSVAEKQLLVEQLQQSLVPPRDAVSELATQQRAWNNLFAELSAIPGEGPGDGFCGADHDRVLYGPRE
ncbi:MAG: hypothetical protein HYX69_01875 [Planctomycetia bacterium]|nr:hypothetical protein [Planctomycetia bacterium]